MHSPILLCHKKDEDRVHVLCQSILQSCPGLKNSMKVVGANEEKSIFPMLYAALFLRLFCCYVIKIWKKI